MLFSHGKIITILQYFTDKVEDYWHILYPVISLEERRNNPYLYFYDISKKATEYNGEFSKEGLYLFKGYDGKYHLHALELAQYSLACWQAWRQTKDDKWCDIAILHCDWLVENQASDGAWRIEHKNPKYDDLPTPWASGMAQGLAISSLLRAYKYTDDIQYLMYAKKASDFLEVSVHENGVRRDFNNVFIYEEYPRAKLNGVLNGYISVVIAMYELSEVDEDYRNMYKMNVANLKKILPLYDCGFWSYYALDKNCSSGFYHRYVIIQLKSLAFIDPVFNHFAKKFEKYLSCRSCMMKALWMKVAKR